MPTQRRDKVARGVQIGGTATAGTVGSMLGAAKLRDAYKEDYGPKHLERVTAEAEKVTPKAGRLARVLSEGKPGFVPLAVGTAGGIAAAGADKYRQHRTKKHDREARPAHVTKGYTPVISEKKQQGILRATDEFSDTVRTIKNRALPPTGKLVAVGADRTRTAVRREEAKLRKSAEPRHRRGARAAEVGLGGGSIAAAGGSLHQTRQGRRLKSLATTQARNSDAQFGMASANAQRARDASAGMRRGQMRHRTNVNLDQARDYAHEAHESIRQGQARRVRSIATSHEARGAFRRARNLRSAALGLGAGAILAHRAADRNR